MIDRQGNKIVIECDCCDETFTGEDHAEWAEVWADARRDGWRAKKVGQDWVHTWGWGKCNI